MSEIQKVTSRPRDTDRKTRIHLSFYDRVKFLLLFGITYLVLTWSSLAENPILSVEDALNETARSKSWLLVLAAIEVVRQIHFLLAELLAPYHGIWSKYFAFTDRQVHRLSDWTRFRLSRIVKWSLVVALLAVILGAIYDEPPIKALFLAPKAFLSALPFLGQLLFAVFFVIIQFAAIFWFLSRGGVDTYFPDDIRTRFSDVWGQDHVLNRIRENLLFLETPEEIEKHGGYVPGGILLWGPPGTGKTLMAESMAGETGKPFVFVDPGAFTNMFFGVGVLKVKSLFRKLRKLALRYGGVVVFFDEADSLGNRGIVSQGGPQRTSTMEKSKIFESHCHGGAYLSEPAVSALARDKFVMGGAAGGGGGGMGTLQALLTELSGLKKPRGFFNRVVRRTLGMRPKNPPKYRILVVMATNMPEALDEALLRPGRIDRMYRVGYPSKAGRIRTYEGYLSKVSHSLTAEEIDKIATITPYATGATIKDTINEALIMAIRNGRTSIEWSDIVKAKQQKELGPSEDVEYIERERHAVAVHEACHAVMAHRTRQHMSIDLATIEKGSDYLGMVASIPPDDQFTRWKSEYQSDILVSLASLAGERMFFDGDNSSGVSGDLESATTIASLMEGHWGMGSTISSHVSNRRFEMGAPGGGKGKDDTDKQMRMALSDRIEENLGTLLTQAEEILRENRNQVLALAHALETHKTMSGEDVAAVIDGVQGSIVDGRPYLDANFLAEIEKYHSASVVAHREHRIPDVHLPVIG
ncbi:putative protease [Candidatus Planktophila sulfonica]|uniref:Putative protease n=1 Tax=Candidatus Planktophila sulfonica TaxID=1884904 RepID=A0A249KI67_9ACTN|nr:AAA family ATPase [Candidatus Planktophila sulfonica]ASY16518.1 putative protease [Candidatus Planktophila sulfonica]